MRVLADVTQSAVGKFFFQSKGMITVDASAGPTSGGLKATLTGVELIEVTIDENTAKSTPVPNGACLALPASFELYIEPPPPTWTCDLEYYRDGQFCDCTCGAWDPDCDDPANDVFDCDDGEVCKKDGSGDPICTNP
jgi:hypothetical protein